MQTAQSKYSTTLQYMVLLGSVAATATSANAFCKAVHLPHLSSPWLANLGSTVRYSGVLGGTLLFTQNVIHSRREQLPLQVTPIAYRSLVATRALLFGFGTPAQRGWHNTLYIAELLTRVALPINGLVELHLSQNTLNFFELIVADDFEVAFLNRAIQEANGRQPAEKVGQLHPSHGNLTELAMQIGKASVQQSLGLDLMLSTLSAASYLLPWEWGMASYHVANLCIGGGNLYRNSSHAKQKKITTTEMRVRQFRIASTRNDNFDEWIKELDEKNEQE